MENDSPPLIKKKIGGPQPVLEQSPILFNKAKQYIEKYPVEKESDDELKNKENSLESKWLKTQDPDVVDKSGSVTPTPR